MSCRGYWMGLVDLGVDRSEEGYKKRVPARLGALIITTSSSETAVVNKVRSCSLRFPFSLRLNVIESPEVEQVWLSTRHCRVLVRQTEHNMFHKGCRRSRLYLQTRSPDLGDSCYMSILY